MRNNSIISFILAITFCFYYITITPGYFSSVIFDICCIVVVLTIVKLFLFYKSSELRGYWICPSILFLIGYLAVNFQYLVDFRIGYKDVTSNMIIHQDVLNQCMILGVVGLLGYVSGYMFFRNFKHSKFNFCKSQDFAFPMTFMCLLNVFSFVGFIVTIDITSFISGADYGKNESNGSNFELFLYLTNALIVLSCARKTLLENSLKEYLKSFPIISLCIIIFYMILRLISGDRGPFLYTAILLFFGYAYSARRKIRFRNVVLLCCGGMFIMSVIGIARNFDNSLSFIERVDKAYDIYISEGRFGKNGEKSFFSMTEELGFSFYVNQIDVHAVEVENASLNYGLYTITGMLSAVPFMPSFLLNQLRIPPEQFSSTGFANLHFFGGYERKWGIGTTILGDFYLQFGVFGVLFGLFITGITLRFLDETIFLSNKEFVGIFQLLFVLLFASKAIYMPRSSLLCDLPRFVHGAIILFFCMKFVRLHKY